MDPIKELALEQAIRVCGMTGDTAFILANAASFEAYLRGQTGSPDIREILDNRQAA